MKNADIYQGKDVLDIMSEYAVNRNNAIEEQIIKYFHLDSLTENISILEFGAGRGEFINRFKKFSHLTTCAVEIDPLYLEALSRNHLTFRYLEDIPQPIDFIFTIDVLEHIRDDEHILRLLHSKLKANGLLLIYVPARPELYSAFDKSIGHYRRYRLKDLRRNVKNAGFSLVVSKYDDFLGYFASLYNKFTTHGSLDGRAVKLYDKYFVPVSRIIESIITLPIGKNILVVAKKD